MSLPNIKKRMFLLTRFLFLKHLHTLHISYVIQIHNPYSYELERLASSNGSGGGWIKSKEGLIVKTIVVLAKYRNYNYIL
jgi:hypothetical protein